MKWGGLAAVLLSACVTAPAPTPVKPEPKAPTAPVPEDARGAVREVVQAFVIATEARRFDQVLPLLARPLRERYSVERLERDFGADPLALDRLAQIKQSTAPVLESKEAASIEWSAGRSLRLVHEAEGWRIAALE